MKICTVLCRSSARDSNHAEARRSKADKQRIESTTVTIMHICTKHIFCRCVVWHKGQEGSISRSLEDPIYTDTPLVSINHYAVLKGPRYPLLTLHCKDFHCKNYRYSLCPFSHCSFNAFLEVTYCIQSITVILIRCKQNLQFSQCDTCLSYF